jgi:hypothetical protein
MAVVDQTFLTLAIAPESYSRRKKEEGRRKEGKKEEGKKERRKEGRRKKERREKEKKEKEKNKERRKKKRKEKEKNKEVKKKKEGSSTSRGGQNQENAIQLIDLLMVKILSSDFWLFNKKMIT